MVDAGGLGPVCDACKVPLGLHADTLAGQACDMNLAYADMVRVIRREFGWLGRLVTVLVEEWVAMRHRWGRP